MVQIAPALPAGPGQPAAPLGVLEALGMGWRLMMSDFWGLWLPAFVLTLVLMAASNFGIIAAVLVQPPLMVGLYWLVARKIDGAPVKIGDVFEGFQQRFGQSVVAWLPVSLVSLVFGVAIAVLVVVLVMPTMIGGMAIAGAGGHGDEEAIAAVVLLVLGILVGGGLLLVIFMALFIFCLFFTFALPAVWDHPESGWEAMRVSARLVRSRFWSVLGLAILLMLIGIAANLVGMVACCIGVFFTAPAAMVWQAAAILYLYRSWTGRPLTQGA
jgi:hypothetical protein